MTSPVNKFREKSREAMASPLLRNALKNATDKFISGRLETMSRLGDPAKMKAEARDIKVRCIARLDKLTAKFSENWRANGGKIHFAADAKEAREILFSIARENAVKLVAKSKSMATEEIELNRFLEEKGIQVVETDLGEYIIQLAKEKPSHIITPAIHKTKEQVSTLFHDKLGTPETGDIQEMTQTAKRVLRNVFLTADMGVTGANFAVAETGTLTLVTNEGNGRMVTSLPRIHVAVVGVEKIVETLADVPSLFKVLPASATGQKITVYFSILSGPRRAGETDGPEQSHVILLDNGRVDMLAGDYRESLYCIRCGACLNVCPVYQAVGGHSYGGTYPGPIGAVVTPLLHDEDAKYPSALPQASSLCGACRDACPVKIDLPRMLVSLRHDQSLKPRGGLSAKVSNRLESLAFWGWAWVAKSPFRFRFAAGVVRGLMKIPGFKNVLKYFPPVSGWTFARDIPAFPKRFGWEKE
jgi:L-lactate dehydrogenase complex protein LldF